MATCPTCSQPTDEDFGLVTCNKCGSQFMLDMDGQASLVEGASEAPAEPVVDSPPPPPDEEPEQIFESPPPPPAEWADSPREVSRPAATADMSELAAYANTEMSSGREGLLRFNIYIAGIDSSDVRRELRDILSDGKFRWNVDQLMASIYNGELKLMEVPAVKSALVVQRLRAVAVEIRWEQYQITQS